MTTTLVLFLTASLLLTLTPGPDLIFVVTQAVVRGPWAGISAALGFSCGCLVHTTLATCGVAAFFQRSPALLRAVQLAGAGYLIFLGIRAWPRPRAADGAGAGEPTSPRVGAGGAVPDERRAEPPGASRFSGALFRQALGMNLLNPKVTLFFLAFLPGFTRPEAGSVAAQMLVLGTLFALLTVVCFGAAGWTAGLLGHRWLAARADGTAAGWVQPLGAGVIAALGVALAVKAFSHR